MKDFYRILDLPQDASQQQIKDRYRQLVRIFHPDRYPKPEDKIYAEQKLQEVNEAYEALFGEGSRGLRLSSDRRPPKPVVYPEQIDLGSVVHGERAHAQLQIDNVGGFAQGLNFHIEDGADWFAITKGERLDPNKPLPMLLHIEARTASLTVGQVVENWLDIDVSGVRARATLRMKVVDRSSAEPRPGRVVSSIAAVVALIVVVYAVWSMWGAAPIDSTASTQPPRSLEATPAKDGGLPVAVRPPSITATETSEVESTVVVTEAATATVDTESPQQRNQVSESRKSNSGVLRPVSQIPSTAIVDLKALSDSSPNDSASHISEADALTATVQFTASVVAKKATATFVPPTAEPPTPSPVPSKTLSPTPTLTPSPTASVASVAIAPPAPTSRPVTITVPQSYQINARAATTTDSESLALLDKGITFPAIARTLDNAWTQIVLADGRTGWVFTTSMVANLAQIETLPVSVDLLVVDPAMYPQSTAAAAAALPTLEPTIQETGPAEGTTALTDSVDTSRQGAEPELAPQFHQVVAGDFLKQLAVQYYGDEEQWSLIYEANANLIGPDPNALLAGIELTIPLQ